LAHHSRSDHKLPDLALKVTSDSEWQITVTDSSEHYAFLLADLRTEIDQFAKWGIQLSVIEAEESEPLPLSVSS